jgi:group I intron endonuclease
MSYVIYKTTNIINNKIYVGQNTTNRKNYLGSGILIRYAIKKYGRENFTKEILETCSDLEELNNREIFWIKHFDSINNKIGYNLHIGGRNIGSFIRTKKYIFTNEHKRNISIGRTNIKLTDEHKRNISLNHADVSGINNPMYNKTHTDEVKKRLSHLNSGRILSADRVLEIKEQTKGEGNPNSKLKESEVLNIRKLYNIYKIRIKDISDMFGLKFACVEKIVKYRTWKHLP